MPLIKEGYANEHTFEERKWNSIKNGFTHFANNDIGIAKITPCFENRKSVVFRSLSNGIGAGTTELFVVRCINNTVLPDYLLWNFKTQKFIDGGVQTYTGDVGQQRVRRDYVSRYLIALPPQAEQNRIINSISSLFELISSLDTSYAEMSDLVLKTKSKILDLAIRGKLVPQDPNDKPASVLLGRIRAEKDELVRQGKIKRDKKESVIFKGEDNSYYLIQNKKAIPADETIVFDLPHSWCWTTLPTIANVELGKTLDRAKNSGTLYPYLRSVNIKWGDIDLSDLNETRFEDDELEKYSVIKNDLLICEGGDVGRCCVWNIDEVFLYQNALHRARMYANIEPKFYQYVLMSYESKGILKRISNGVTIKHLTGTTLSFMPIPLPPAEEQLRIIETIELLFAKLDAIKESLN